jgi:glutathione S-transferase
MIVHHLSNSHSHVVLWLLEELGVDHEIVRHERDAVTGKSPPSLAAVHPMAKAPTIIDHGRVMIESTGIILYLLEAYGEGRLRPAPGTPEAMAFHQHLTFIEGSAKTPLMALLRTAGLPADDPRRQAAEQYARGPIDILDQAVADGGGTLVPGQFTAADMQLAFFEELLEAILPIEQWPNLQAHLARARTMDSYKRAEEKGGPVALGALFERITRAMRAAQTAG